MKIKRLLCSILAIAMILSTMSFTVFAEEGEDASSVSTWDGISYSLDWLSTGNPEATSGDEYYLKSVNDLAGLAYYVNTYSSTNNIFTGDTIYLTVDVDLAGFDWAPIGTAAPREKNRFYGSFDGQGNTISNLKVEEGHYFAGLFGQIPTYTYTQKFSNLTIHNANVTAANETETGKSKEAAGALIGRANGAVIENCHVTGEISISGDRFVGGLLGHSYAQISDCSVEAYGTINADTWQAGGLVGAHGATKSYVSSIEKCSVIGDASNGGITVKTEYAPAGGLAGAITLSDVEETTVNNIIVKNVNIVANSDTYGDVDDIATGYEATNATVENVVASLNVAKINDVYYATLKEAINAASDGDVIMMIADVELTEVLTVEKNRRVTIDLNGHELVYNSTIQGEAMITNKGDLTINDSVGDGVINYNYTGAPDPNYGKGNYTISNAGKLTVNGGKITIANISNHAKYPVDNNSTTGDAVLVINGGHLYNYNTSAIRQFCNSTTYKNSVTINGGLIEGYSAIWMQNPGSKTVNGSLSVTGGEIKSTAKAWVNGTSELKDVSSAIYCTTAGGAWSEDSSVSITGGTINENVYLVENAPANIEIGEDAEFNGYVEAPANKVPSIAKVGDVEYTDLQSAIQAAAPRGTVEIISDVTVDKWVMFSQTKSIGNGNIITLEMDGLTINGNGHSLTVNTVESAGNGGYLFDDAENLNINDLSIKVNSNAGGIHLESGIINNVTFNGGNCIFPGDGDITITNCTFNTLDNNYVIYYETPKNNLKVTDNEFNVYADDNVIILYGNETFTGNTINSGRTVNVASGSPVVSNNIFADGVRFKVYNQATATITNNTLTYVVFNDGTKVNSTFKNNILSDSAKEALTNAGVIFEDAVFTTETYGIATDGTASISFNAFYTDFKNAEIEKYGMFIYGDFDENKGCKFDSTEENLTDGWFNAVVEAIPENSFDSVIVMKPFVVIGEETIYGDVVEAKASDFINEI